MQQIEQHKICSLAGRIIHIKDLFIGSRIFVEELLKANSSYTDKKDRNMMVGISNLLKRELWWWYSMVMVCANQSKYPDPDASLPIWALDSYTDAAGGTTLCMGSGCGAILEGCWTYIP